VAEWRGQLWGIIPPALEQAPIVAANIAGEDRTYRGTTPSNTLKVVGINLAIFGETNPQDAAAIQLRSLDPQGKSYAKLVLLEGKVVGAIALNRRALQATLGKMVSEKRTLELDEAQQIVKGSIL
jgi:NAD(P)H-nitrite reductase large subunit